MDILQKMSQKNILNYFRASKIVFLHLKFSKRFIKLFLFFIFVFLGVTAVIFVAAISEYDQKLFEDATTNRMVRTHARTH